MSKVKGFLQEVAARLHEQAGTDLSSHTVLFPNRRGIVFFRAALAQQAQGPILAPKMLSIEDYLLAKLGYTKPDNLALTMLLYEVYLGLEDLREPQSFEIFSHWAACILDDFNTIDSHLVDPDKVYKYVRDAQEIDRTFEFIPTAYADVLRTFWKGFTQQDKASADAFLSLWSLLASLYHNFLDALAERSWVYWGSLLRAAVQAQQTHKNILIENTHLIGFHDITSAEHYLITELISHYQAQVHWDGDAYYVLNKAHSAGYFFRLHQNDSTLLRSLPSSFPSHFEQSKHIECYGCASLVEQVRTAGALVAEYCQTHPTVPKERIAIILPQSATLFPLLSSLPASLNKEVNISMGYEVWHSDLSALVQAFLLLKEGVCTQERMASLLKNAYLRVFTWEFEIKDAQRTVRTSDISDISFLHNAYNQPSTLDGIIALLGDIAKEFNQPDVKGPLSAFERAVLETMQQQWIQLSLLPTCARLEELSKAAQRRFFISYLRSIQVPFIGEPLRGLQIMGILESRNLDFDAVFVLDLHEGTWPPAWNHHTLLPWPVRQTYELPMQQDFDARQTYLFYRLLQRANTAFLLHINQQKGLQKTEKSRFIYQLQYDSPHVLHHKMHQHSPAVHLPTMRKIGKEGLHDLLQKKDYTLSVSHINNYLECPFRFYFSALLKLSSLAQTPAILYGNLLHQSLQNLYTPWLNRTIEPAALREMPIEQAVTDAWKSQSTVVDIQKGKDYLFHTLIKEHLRRIIAWDLKRAPFEIVGIEEKVSNAFDIQGQKVTIHGKIDRIDRQGETYTVLDYKTGKVEPLRLKKNDPKHTSMTDLLFDRTQAYKRNEWRQLALYMLLYDKPSTQAVIYSTRAKDPQHLGSFDKQAVHTALVALLEEIMDTSTCFTPYEAVACRYCPYGMLCCATGA